MNPYAFTLYLGAGGLLVMAVGGLGHGHGASGGHHASGGRDVGDVSLGGHIAGGHTVGHVAGHGHATGLGGRGGPRDGTSAGRALSNLLSPRVLFSVLVGFGATGLLLRPWLGGVLLFVAALLGGALFEALVVAPLWRFLFRFASNPALTLESTLMDTARAASGFDAAGHGLVAVELDGQVVQLLGTLAKDELSAGVRVRAGDRVRIEDVDAARNRCTVSYLGR